MADNVILNSGSGGATAATDDIGGVQYQRVKPNLGADGVANDAIPVVAGLDTTATGVQAVGIVGQFDDAATSSVTENQFAPIRISTRRALLVEGVASGTAIAVSAASLPLPTDAATETTLSALAGDVGDTADAAAVAGGTGTLHAKQRLMTSQLDSIKTAVETIDNFISGARGLVTEDNSAAIKTSVELIDDAIKADDAAFTPATTKVMMAGFEFDDAAPDSVDEGDAGAARMSARREVYVQLRDAAGNERGLNVDGSGAIAITVASIPSHAVTNAGTFVVQENGAALTALQLIDDPVATLGTTTYTEATTKGMIIGAVRRDADTTLVDTTNEIGPVQMDANGRLKVEAFSGETLPVSFTGSTDVATQTTLASVLTSVQLIDDIVYTDDTSTHSTGTSKGALFMAAATPTDASVNANDIGAVAMTTDRKLHVSVQDALPAGANAIGKLAANSGVDIGDVDVITLPNVTLAAGTNTNEVVGDAAHDAAAAGNPLLMGGYASAAAPADVSADADAVRAWHLRNGATATVITAAGALVGGDAANGLDVDVTRSALPTGASTEATLVTINTAVNSKYITGILDGRKEVTTAGTRETLAGSTACKKVIITAETDNTGVVVVGGTTVVAALATRRGTPLFAGDSIELEIDNLTDVNLDVTVNTEGVTYTYFT